MSDCFAKEVEDCRDSTTARNLKIVAFASIFIAGAIGIAIPIVGKSRRFLRADGTLFVAGKAFAGGVILATGFIHMLPDGNEALSNECLWFSKFPFSGFFAMLAGLLTLLVDFSATRYYEGKHHVHQVPNPSPANQTASTQEKSFRETGDVLAITDDFVALSLPGNHGHVHGFIQNDGNNNLRQIVVSQILELGILSHSIIIGISLGVSESPCTIRPLIAALSFHQFFEGFALGGCISQAEFKRLTTAIMACFFAVTTPLGIGIGAAISSVYNANSKGALITEGILDSMSAGILIYLALVNLIAADFLAAPSSTSVTFRKQLFYYFMLLLGAGLMSCLAIWA